MPRNTRLQVPIVQKEKSMKKYLVCVKTKNGEFQRYETLANNVVEAKNSVQSFCQEAAEIVAFDYMTQFE